MLCRRSRGSYVSATGCTVSHTPPDVEAASLIHITHPAPPQRTCATHLPTHPPPLSPTNTPRPAPPICQKPSDAELQSLVAPVGEQLVAVGALAEGGPRSKYVQHFKLLAEAAQGLTWVVYTGPACGGWVGWVGVVPARLLWSVGVQQRVWRATRCRAWWEAAGSMGLPGQLADGLRNK